MNWPTGAMTPMTRKRCPPTFTRRPSAFSAPKSSVFSFGPRTATGIARPTSDSGRKRPSRTSNLQTSGPSAVAP